MLDHIDLEQLGRSANVQRSGTRRGRVITLTILFLVLVFLGLNIVSLQVVSFNASGTSSVIAVKPDGSLRTIQALPGNPSNIRISPVNVIWIASQDTLSRLDGSVLTTYNAADFGVQPEIIDDFVLSEQHVWAVAGSIVLHFDGNHWENYPDVLEKIGATAIAAHDSNFWALSDSGDLSHYDGQQWAVIHLATTLPVKPSDDSYQYGTLAVTPDGTLWLALDNLWRFNGRQWQAVPSNFVGADASIIAAAGNRVWLDDGGDLVWISEDETSSGRYSAANIGLARDEYITSLLVKDNSPMVGTNESIVTFDGTLWHRMAEPVAVQTSMKQELISTALGPDGTWWAISVTLPADDPTSLARQILPLVLLMLGGIVVFGILFVRLFSNSRGEHQRQVNTLEVIRRALPDLVQRKVVGPNGAPFYLIIGVAVVVNPFFFQIVPRLFPWFSADVDNVIATAVWIGLLTLGKRLFDRATHPGAVFVRPIRGELALSLFVTLYIVIGAQGLQWLNTRLQTGSASTLLAIAVFGTAALLGLFGIPLIALRIVLRHNFGAARALRDANYDRALAEIAKILRSRPESAVWQSMQGTALLLAGRYTEAESALREALAVAAGASKLVAAATLNNLGVVFARQKRYDDAIRLYEAAVAIDPTKSWHLNSIAEIYLEQGTNIERAFRFIEQARANKLRDMRTGRENWAAILANQAWALTLLNQPNEVENLLHQALRETNQKAKPSLAALHYRIGHVLSLRGEKGRAEEHFRQSLRIDSHGAFARDATEALQNIG